MQEKAGAMVLWEQARCIRFSAALSTPGWWRCPCCKGVAKRDLAKQPRVVDAVSLSRAMCILMG